MALYNQIGLDYNITRKADPYLTDRLYEHLSQDSNGLFLDIGCGTGNYLQALTQKGLSFYGIDPSEIMLEKAKLNNPNTKFIQAEAENIPLPENTFNGAIAVFTFHHWKDQTTGLRELHRVLKPQSHLVFLSFTPQQMEGYWLNHYFPEMMKKSMTIIPDLEGMQSILEETGFAIHSTEKYFVKDDLQDHFLYSSKQHPERYLIPAIRNNASSFSAFSNVEEVEKGLKELKRDIVSGAINKIIDSYENDLGDYLFINAIKQENDTN